MSLCIVKTFWCVMATIGILSFYLNCHVYILGLNYLLSYVVISSLSLLPDSKLK